MSLCSVHERKDMMVMMMRNDCLTVLCVHTRLSDCCLSIGAGADEILARAAYFVERGDLKASVKELEALTVRSDDSHFDVCNFF